MAVVGSASVTIRADTSKLLSDIQKQLGALDGIGDGIGQKISDGIRRGVEDGLGGIDANGIGNRMAGEFHDGFAGGPKIEDAVFKSFDNVIANARGAGAKTMGEFAAGANGNPPQINVPIGDNAAQAGSDAMDAFEGGANSNRPDVDLDMSDSAGRGGDRSGSTFMSRLGAAIENQADKTSRPFEGLIKGFMDQIVEMQVTQGIMAGAAGAVSSLVSGLISLGSAAAYAIPSMLKLGNVVAALGQGMIVGKSLFSGVGKAIGEMGKQTSTAAKQTKSYTSALKSALDEEERLLRIREARDALDDAIIEGARSNEDAIERVSDATEALSDAIYAEAEAQEAVGEARDAARERLEDLQLALDRASLTEERAALNLTKAEKKLNDARAGGNAQAIYEADLAYREQLQTVKEVQERNGDLRDEANQAQAEGVDGNEAVIEAQEAYSDAIEKTSDAQRELQRATEDVARVAVDVTLRIARAQLNLKKALEEPVDPSKSFGGASAGMSQLESAMSKLHPAAQAFVRYWSGTVMPLIDSIKRAGQAEFFPKLQEATENLVEHTGFVNMMRDAYTETASVLGDFAVNLSEAFTAPATMKAMNTILDSNVKILDTLGDAAVNLVQPLTQVFAATAPYAEKWAESVKGATAEFSNFIAEAEKSGELDAFFKKSSELASQFWQVLKNLGGTLVGIFKAALPAGEQFLDGLVKMTAEWKEGVANPDNQKMMEETFKGASDNALAFVGILDEAAVAFFKLGANPALGDIARAIEEVIPAFGELADDAANQVLPAIERIILTLPQFGAFFTQTGVIESFMNTLATGLEWVATLLEKISQNDFLMGIIQQAGKLVGIFSAIGLGVGVASKAIGKLKDTWKGITTLGGLIKPKGDSGKFFTKGASDKESYNRGWASKPMPGPALGPQAAIGATGAVKPMQIPVEPAPSKGFGDKMKGIGKNVTGKVSGGFRALGGAMSSILSPMNLIMGGVVLLLPLLIKLFNENENVKNAVMGLVDAFMGMVGGILDALAPLLPIIMDVVSQLASALVPVITMIVETLAQVITALMPIITLIIDVFMDLIMTLLDALIPVIQQLLPVIMELVTVFIDALMPVIQALLPIILDLVVMLIETLMPVIQALLPVIMDLVKTFLDALIPVIQLLLPIILDLVKMFIEALMPVIQALLPIIMDLVNMFLEALMPVIEALLPIILDLVTMFIDALLPVIQALLPIFLELVMLFIDLLLPVIKDLLPIFTELITMFINMLVPVLQILLPIIVTLIKVFMEVYSTVIRFILPIFMKIIEIVIKLLVPVIEALFEVIKMVFNVASTIIQAFFNAFKWYWNNVGKPIFQFLTDAFNAIKDTVEGVIDFVERTWKGIIDAIAGPIETVVKGINDWLINPLNKVLDKFGMHIDPLVVNIGGRATGGPAEEGGGYIKGPGGPMSDMIPTMLSNGEYVVRTSSVRSVGQDTMDYINRHGMLPPSIGGAFRGPRSGGMGGPLDWVEDKLKQGVGFVLGEIMDVGLGLAKANEGNLIGDLVMAILKKLKEKMKEWGTKKDEEEAAREQAAGGTVTPYKGPDGGWTNPTGGLGTPKTYAGHRNPGSYDLGIPVGSAIFAVSSGRVYKSVNLHPKSYGQYLAIVHAKGEKSLYAHLSQRLVKLNEIVKTGQKIAKSGNTGRSTGPHLHFELNQPKDAKAEMRRHGVTLAEGGTVRATTGGILALLAEGGRSERVTPLDSQGRSATEVQMLEVLRQMATAQTGGDTFQVFPAPGMNERELAVKVSREVAFQHRRRS